MATGVASTVLVVTIIIVSIVGIYYALSGKSQSTTGNNYTPIAPGQQPQYNQYGGRRKKRGNKKSTTMTTTGIYLLLGTVLVGYIVSRFR